MKRVITCILIVSLLIGALAVPSYAAEFDNDFELQVLDYATANGGTSNRISFTGSGTASYQLPDVFNLSYVDILFNINNGTPTLSISGGTSSTSNNLTVVQVGRYLYRAYGYIPTNFFNSLHLHFTSTYSGSCTVVIKSFKVYTKDFITPDIRVEASGYYPDGDIDLSLNWGDNRPTYIFFQPSGEFYDTQFFVDLFCEDWRLYDFVDIQVSLSVTSISSIGASFNGQAVPFTVNEIISDGAFIQLYYLVLRLDLRGLDRNAEGIPHITISGSANYDHVNAISLHDATGFCEIEFDSISYFFNKLFSSLSSHFGSLSSLISDFRADFNSFVSGWSDSLDSSFGAVSTNIINAITSFRTNLITELSSHFTSLSNIIGDFQSNISATVSSSSDTINASIGSVGTSINNAISSFRTNLINDLTSHFSSLSTVITDFRTNVNNVVNSCSEFLNSSILSIGSNIVSSVDDFRVIIKDTVTQCTDLLNGSIGSVESRIDFWGQKLLDAIVGKQTSDTTIIDGFRDQNQVNSTINVQVESVVGSWSDNIGEVTQGFNLSITNAASALIWLSGMAQNVFTGMDWFGNIFFFLGFLHVFFLLMSKSGLGRSISRIDKRGDD